MFCTALQLHKFRFRRFKSSLERQAYADTTISWHYFFRKGQKELAEAWAAMLPDSVSITVRRLAYVFVNATSSYGYDAVVPGVSNTLSSVTSQKIRILNKTAGISLRLLLFVSCQTPVVSCHRDMCSGCSLFELEETSGALLQPALCPVINSQCRME